MVFPLNYLEDCEIDEKKEEQPKMQQQERENRPIYSIRKTTAENSIAKLDDKENGRGFARDN